MSNFRKIRESFSWPLALVFLGVGILAVAALEILVTDYDARGRVRSVDGLGLAYETQGEGPPLVTLAGGPGASHHGFHPYLGRLGHRATVIYFDPRGRGDSDEASSYSVADDVRDVESLRKGLGLERVDVLGVSYGAHLAVAYALEYPRNVRKLVLVSPIVGRSAWEAHMKLLLDAPGMEAVMSSIRRERGQVLLSESDTGRRILTTLMPLYWCDSETTGAMTRTSRRRHQTMTQNFQVYEDIVGRPFGELNGDLAASDVETRLGEVNVPVLLIEGKCDHVIPEGHVDGLAVRLPRAEKLLFPDAGHSPFVERPHLFAEMVGSFLAASGDPP